MTAGYYHLLGVVFQLWALFMVGIACTYFMAKREGHKTEVAPLPLLLTALLELSLGFLLLRA